MLERDEIARSLTGAWDLFLDRPAALRHFDVSIEGFWRSFRAIILVAPAYALATMGERVMSAADALAGAQPDAALLVIDAVLGLGLDWIALPIILAVVARPLGIARRYAAFIVARNWSAVIAVAPFGAIGLLVVLGVVGSEVANFLMLAALFVVLRYNFIVARRALDVGVGFAIGIVVLDLAVSLTIALTLDALLGV